MIVEPNRHILQAKNLSSIVSTEDGICAYAPGGGAGHVRRISTLFQNISFRKARLFHQSHITWITHENIEHVHISPTWDVETLREELVKTSQTASTLLVDTFPAGMAGELNEDVLRCFTHKILIARWLDVHVYERIASYEAMLPFFDTILVPYPCEHDEWEDFWSSHSRMNVVHTGWMVRQMTFSSSGPIYPLVLFASSQSLPDWLLDRLPQETYIVREPLPSWPRAHRYLSYGAGYNMSFEMVVSLSSGTLYGLVPLIRRYDNQFARAQRLDRAILHADDLDSFLEVSSSC